MTRWRKKQTENKIKNAFDISGSSNIAKEIQKETAQSRRMSQWVDQKRKSGHDLTCQAINPKGKT